MERTHYLNSGNSFIDENHIWLLNSIMELSGYLRGNNLDDFQYYIKKFIVDLENHFSHEETILKGANFAEIDYHIIQHRTISLNLRIESLNSLDIAGAIGFFTKSRSDIARHELIDDQKYWTLFENEERNFPNLIVWSKKLETSDHEINLHHEAMVNLINRLNAKFMKTQDIDYVCKELNSILEYSRYHFSEEEKLLGGILGENHKMHHNTIINDLNNVIQEVQTGNFEPKNLGDYLKFWLLNHIKNFDIPAFEQKSPSD
jgi:hemerythrin